jgi:hypothetical protein
LVSMSFNFYWRKWWKCWRGGHSIITPSCIKNIISNMYAYGNHIHVKSAKVNLVIMDSKVAATFTTMCKSNRHTRQQSNQSRLGIHWMGWRNPKVGLWNNMCHCIIL